MPMTPLRAIREKCLDCMCGNSAEVSRCPCSDGVLFPFRTGHNPNIKMTEEQKAARAANLRKKAHVHGA